MSKRSIDLLFTGSAIRSTEEYDPEKIILGRGIYQFSGTEDENKYAGPMNISVARPMEASTAIPGIYPHVIDLGDGTQWVFLADNSTAAATRRIICYRFIPETQEWSWRGFITLTYPPATAHTIRALRVCRHLNTNGTVGVSGTTVSGSGTSWQTNRYAVGSRIGFGSTNPNNITQWYYISAIGSDTSITLTSSPGTITSGTPFVIEELRIYTATTNATATNGGLFVAKGINYDDFVIGGTTIPAATTVDNIKAVYWLADAATNLNTISSGMGLGTQSDTSHFIYVANNDSTTLLRIYKYDVRVGLSGLSAGRSVSAFLYRTGQQATTGILGVGNSCRMITLNHGPGEGVPSLYVAASSRVLRCSEFGITNLSVSFISDAMVEIPPGGTSTFPLTGGISSVEKDTFVDKLIITTSASNKNYITSYQTNSDQFDRFFSSQTNQQDQSNSDINLIPIPHSNGGAFSVWSENGFMYLARIGTTAIINQLYVLPIVADWDYANSLNGRLISPKISTPSCIKYNRVNVMDAKYVGDEKFGIQPEPWKIYYRTSGIDNNSGTWNLINYLGDISGVSGSNHIQFMFEFRIFGQIMLPSRIFGLSVSYEDSSTDSHYQPSVGLSNISSKIFAWRHSVEFGSTVPNLNINLYDAITGSLLLTDDTNTSLNGNWQKTINGGSSWIEYNTNDKTNEETYIRYIPFSLADNIKVRAQLTQ